MYTAPFRFSKISPQTFLFLKNAYTVSWILFWGEFVIFFGATFSNISHLFEKLDFIPFIIMGITTIVYLFIPVIFYFLSFRNKMEMTLEGDKMLFLDKTTKEILFQHSVQNIKNVSLDYKQIGRYRGRVYTFLLEDSISGLQAFVMSSGSQMVVSRTLFEFESELSKNGVMTKEMKNFFAKKKKFGQIIIGILLLLVIIFLTYRFLF